MSPVTEVGTDRTSRAGRTLLVFFAKAVGLLTAGFLLAIGAVLNSFDSAGLAVAFIALGCVLLVGVLPLRTWERRAVGFVYAVSACAVAVVSWRVGSAVGNDHADWRGSWGVLGLYAGGLLAVAGYAAAWNGHQRKTVPLRRGPWG